MELMETLQFYRKRQGLSQVELAEALDVSRQTISKWETGTALPAAEHLLSLSKLYGVPVDALLNGAKVDSAPPEEAPEFATVAMDLPAPPPAPELTAPPRWKLVLRILAAVFVCDVIAFFMDVSLYSAGGQRGFLYFAQIFRILSCCSAGLFFAWQDRLSPVNKKTSLRIAAAALALALYTILFPARILWRLYDFVAWYGLCTPEAMFPPNAVRTFIGWTLFDELAFTCHMGLIAIFQLGRLRFSRIKRPLIPQPQAVHQA